MKFVIKILYNRGLVAWQILSLGCSKLESFFKENLWSFYGLSLPSKQMHPGGMMIFQSTVKQMCLGGLMYKEEMKRVFRVALRYKVLCYMGTCKVPCRRKPVTLLWLILASLSKYVHVALWICKICQTNASKWYMENEEMKEHLESPLHNPVLCCMGTCKGLWCDTYMHGWQMGCVWNDLLYWSEKRRKK